MKRFLSAMIFSLLWLGLSGGWGWAGQWPRIEAALSSWQGPKTLALRSDLQDPLASPVIQALLEDLLQRGFQVIPVPADAAPRQGLILDIRLHGENRALALSRGADGAIIAFERTTGAPPVERSERTSQTATRAVPDPPEEGAPSGPLALPGHPRGLALLETGDGGQIEFALLYDHGVDRYRLQGSDLQRLATYRPPLPAPRALHLSAGDLTGDGRNELAAVWAQDVTGIYEGTDSRLHGWILDAAGTEIAPLSPDLSGYLRMVGENGYLQRRGPFVPFSGPVLPLVKTPEGYCAGEKEIPWAGAGIYGAIPLDAESALGWDEDGNLQLFFRGDGQGIPGSLLLGDFAAANGPEVAVRLETPEFRSGFGKEDRVTETYHPLPGRILVGAEGVAYSILRGRSAGLPLVGKPTGRDAVVRVLRQGNRLALEKPFGDLEAFILDFALVERSGQSPAALLLLNEEIDGSGHAYLLLEQQPEASPAAGS